MKKLTKKQKLYRLYRSNKAQKKIIRHNHEIRKNKRIRNRFNHERTPYSVWCPEEIDLLGKYGKKTFDFIVEIKEKAEKYKKVHLLMQNIHRINAVGMALLTAEVTALQHNSVLVTLTKPKSIKERAVLKHTGFLDLVGVKSDIETKHFKSVKRWEVVFGNEKNDDYMIDLESLMEIGDKPKNENENENENENKNREIFEFEMNRGISEAVSNTMHHAYMGRRDDYFQLDIALAKWWAFSCYNETSDTFTIITIDLGVGMARSIDSVYEEYRKTNKLTTWKGFSQLFKGKSDHDIIKMLAEGNNDSISSTNLPYRGLGMQTDIVSMSKDYSNTDIAIFSNKGYYRTKDGSSESSPLPNSVNGTIIAWTIRLGETIK